MAAAHTPCVLIVGPSGWDSPVQDSALLASLGGLITAMDASQTSGNATGTALDVGTYVKIDSEVLWVQEINANWVEMERGKLGTVGAAHITGSDIYPYMLNLYEDNQYASQDSMEWTLTCTGAGTTACYSEPFTLPYEAGKFVSTYVTSDGVTLDNNITIDLEGCFDREGKRWVQVLRIQNQDLQPDTLTTGKETRLLPGWWYRLYVNAGGNIGSGNSVYVTMFATR